MQSKMDDEYLILHPEKGGVLQLFNSLLPGHGFIEYPDHLRPRHIEENRWIIKLCILARKFLHLIAKPMASFGFCIEFVLNLLSNNGGLTGVIFRLLKGEGLIKPERGAVNFRSFIGHLDGRLDLDKREDNRGNAIEDHTEQNIKLGGRHCADLCMMASKLAYENESVIREVVEKHWKMHFVEFLNCWNEFLKRRSTQAFIFCDKSVDAKLVVIAFRGTEPFDADDWSTDCDLSWFKMEPIGRIHLGFLEAMGLANRSSKEIIQHHHAILKQDEQNTSEYWWPDDVPEDDEKGLAYYTIRKRLVKLLEQNKDAKYIVTGHSLGGALAVLFPAILLLHKRKELLDRLLAIYTFGQPRVGDEQMGNYMNLNLNQPVPRYFRVVYCNDMVPRLPYDNKVFLFKHFGACVYYNSCYKVKTLTEEPNRNFSMRYYIPDSLNAVWELIHSLLIGCTKGKEYRESFLGILFRLVGLVLPGISAHNPGNYLNAIRLGPSWVYPNLPQDAVAVANGFPGKAIHMDYDNHKD